ncbi:transducin/WD40 repeat-like superfamily protein [Actinidia rufa]|uniref:Transducin/WD40 repeat-like superfamily protein n=1 Tax=Actinidia rufa TaxID=165716 RepID=A0A7J0EFG3_9ERIC|nr:transducin/WD40 repeat-like superfamily protein [Actinidia rufa]
MASTSSSSLVSSHENERMNIESIRVVVASINRHISEFVADTKTWKSVKLKCTSKLRIQKREFFEFSEHTILSNLYWGIESIEAAIRSQCAEEKSCRLKNSERMLQVPALLDEDGVTAGISNRYLVCCSYFYLSVVRKFQGDEWQVALHFLQAVLVSPRLVWTQFTPKMCNSLFVSCVAFERQGSLRSKSPMDFDGDAMSEKIVHMARRYKAWLTYYQVMLYGEKIPQWHSGCRNVDSADDESQSVKNRKSSGTESSKLQECGNSLLTYSHFEKVHPLDPQEYATHNMAEVPKVSDAMGFREHIEAPTDLDRVHSEEVKRSLDIRCLQDLLTESQSDAPISEDSCNGGSADEDEYEVYADGSETPNRTVMNADDLQPEIFEKKQVAAYLALGPEHVVSVPQAPKNLAYEEANEGYITNFFSGRLQRSFSAFELSILELREMDLCTLMKSCMEGETTNRRLHKHDLKIYNRVTSKGLNNYRFTQMDLKGSTKRRNQNGKGSEIELMGILEKAISNLCFSEGLGRCDEDYTVEVVKLYEMLSNKRGVKYNLLKDIILGQLLTAISTSKEVGVIRASVSILSTLVSLNKAIIEDINKNGLHLCDLASALKGNVHEAAILIYLMNPSPAEIKTLGLLPTLVEVVCTSNTYKAGLASLLPTPSVASLMIIEVLVTAFDCATNNMHLAAINSPRILTGLLDVPRNNNLEDFASLGTILEDSTRKSTYREEAVEALLDLLTCEESSSTQQLSAFLLSNLGGTYAWTGEPYTVAWLLKKTGLTTQNHRNMIRSFDWMDQSLQEPGTDTWCSKIASSVTKLGKPVFHALMKGLKSKIKNVSRDCLTAIAWIGCEIASTPDNLRYNACEIMLTAVEQFLHPGSELEERLLACLCIYNYASGKGMQKLIYFSEGVKESLRRLSNITWMAEELLRVADYFQPNKWVWDIKGQTATLVLDMKEHKKAVKCFSLFEPGDCMLSGSADKTIRVWQMVQSKLECIEIIGMKEPIHGLDTFGQLIFAVTQSHEMKELAIANNRELEIKAPSKIWMLQSKPINSIFAYKDWLYTASAVVEGSNIKIWLRGTQQKVGRLSAGSKITSLLTGNDIVLCGTEKGLIKVSTQVLI